MDKKEKTYEEKLLIELEAILSKHFNRNYFEVNGEDDSALCLNQLDGKWNVFFKERNSRFGRKSFDTLQDACFDVLDRMCLDFNEMEHVEEWKQQLLRSVSEE